MSSFHTRDDGTFVFLVHLTLKPERDDELIKFVRACPKRLLARNIHSLLKAGQLTQKSNFHVEHFTNKNCKD